MSSATISLTWMYHLFLLGSCLARVVEGPLGWRLSYMKLPMPTIRSAWAYKLSLERRLQISYPHLTTFSLGYPPFSFPHPVGGQGSEAI